MNLKSKFHSAVFELIHDRIPGLSEEFIAGVDHVFGDRREAVEHVPDRRAGEAGDNFRTEICGGARAEFHLLDRPFAFRLFFACELRRSETVGAAVVVGVAGELTGKVITDRPELEVVFLESVKKFFAVFLIGCGLVDVEVIAGSGELKSLVAPGCGFGGHCFERQISPLSGKQSDWSHSFSLLPLNFEATLKCIPELRDCQARIRGKADFLLRHRNSGQARFFSCGAISGSERRAAKFFGLQRSPSPDARIFL